MAKYDKETRFYWLQLKEDFFEEDAIEWLEEQDNGHKYSLFYLKLCLKSLKTNGILIRKVGDMLVPYDNKKLAEMTKMSVDTVIVAMELLKGIGLVKVLDGGELYITQLENMIGSTSKGALKKQQQRSLLKENQLLLGKEDKEETKGGHLSTKDKDKDKDKIIDKKKDIKKKYGEYQNVSLTDKEYNSLISEYGSSTNDFITYLDEYIEMKGAKYKSCYLAIKKWVIKAVKEKASKTVNINLSKYDREEIIPEWLNNEELNNNNKERKVIDLLAETKEEDPEFEARAKALQERLRSKYGASKKIQ